MERELLFAVEHARDVDTQILQEGRPTCLVAERDRERGRRDDVAPGRRGTNAVVEVERVQIADGAREVL
jgi:hypothetical protein